MKGVIFTELVDLVRQRHGVEFLHQWLCGVDSATDGAYTAVGTYPDQEMYDLVASLGRRTGSDAAEILHDFGKQLFARLIDRYPAQIGEASSFPELLESLEKVIHPNVQKLYPDAVLPRFSTTRLNETSIEMRYQSPRGLSDLAAGLIQGCADWFGESIRIEKRMLNADGTAATFRIECRETDGTT